MARGRTVPLLSQPVIVSMVCAELDTLIDNLNGDGYDPITEARAMLLRQVRAEIRDAAPLETEDAERDANPLRTLHPDGSVE